MKNESYGIDVVVTHYRRASHLKNTLEAVRRATKGFFGDVIVCDDGSGAEIISLLHDFEWDVLCTVRRNSGLGANLNRGLRLFRRDWLFYVQDDWDLQAPADFIKRSLSLMKEHPDVGMVRYYVPNMAELEKSSSRRQGTFGEAIIFYKPAIVTHANRDIYSDTPSLRSRKFVESMGFYKEGVGMAETENEYVDRFLNQSEYKVAVFADNGWQWARHTGEESSIRLPASKKKVDNILYPVRVITRIFPLKARYWLRARYERVWELMIKAVR